MRPIGGDQDPIAATTAAPIDLPQVADRALAGDGPPAPPPAPPPASGPDIAPDPDRCEACEPPGAELVKGRAGRVLIGMAPGPDNVPWALCARCYALGPDHPAESWPTAAPARKSQPTHTRGIR